MMIKIISVEEFKILNIKSLTRGSVFKWYIHSATNLSFPNYDYDKVKMNDSQPRGNPISSCI